jgi:short-subunit dehydrogenase
MKEQQKGEIGSDRKTVIITGASSGIGKAAAIEFARKGYNVVGVARSQKGLDDMARECEAAGGKGFVQAMDVTDPDGLAKVAHNAMEWFGKIDLWVNNAALTIFGRLEDLPQDDLKRVIDTNLMGYINGARAVIPCFRKQGKGVLVNVSSIVGKTGQPYTIPYTVSKAAIISLSNSLRMELHDAPGIHVCTVIPPSIDTPLFQHGANYSGWSVKPMDPVYHVDEVVKALVRLADRPQREVFIGNMAKFAAAAHKLAPSAVEKMMATKVPQDHFQNRNFPASHGNLFEPNDEWTSVSGGWEVSERQILAEKVAIGLGAAAVGLGFLAWLNLKR